MAGFFIKIGHINKKLIMLGILTVLYITMDIIEYFSKMEELHFIFDLYTRGISYTTIIIIPKVLKCWDKKNKVDIKEKEKSQCNKKSILHFGFLHLVYTIYIVVYIVLTTMKNKLPQEDIEDFKMSHYHGLCTEEAIEIIFILVVSKILLKTKLYIHHYLGLIIFISFSLGIDVLLELSIFRPGFEFLAVYIVFLILDSLFITIEKYMMDKKYYSPYIIIFSIGILYLFAATLFTIICYMMEKNINFKTLGNTFNSMIIEKLLGIYFI